MSLQQASDLYNYAKLLEALVLVMLVRRITCLKLRLNAIAQVWLKIFSL